MKKLPLLSIILVVTTLVVTSCSPKAVEPSPVSAAGEANLFIAEGSLQPVNMQEQSFNLSGEIAEVLVQDGEVVVFGQELARLQDSPEANLAIARAEQELLTAQQTLDNMKVQAKINLAESKLVAINAQDALEEAQANFDGDESPVNQAELDMAVARLALAEDTQSRLASGEGIDPDQLAAAEARLASAQATLISAQATLKALTLTASIDGTLIDLDIQPGQLVTANVPVITIADISDWVVKTDNLTEIDVTSISLGQKVEITLDALPNLSLTGEVTHINARFEENAATSPIRSPYIYMRPTHRCAGE